MTDQLHYSERGDIAGDDSQAQHLAVPLSEDAVGRLSTDLSWKQALNEAVAPFTLNIRIARDGAILTGDRPALLIAKRALEAAATGDGLFVNALQRGLPEVVADLLKRDLAFRLEGVTRPLRALSVAQLAFMDDLLDLDKPMVIGLGPTGTGKTFLPLVAGINMLAKETIKHFIVTRPHQMLEGELMTAETRAETKADEQFAVFTDILTDLIGPDETDSLIAHRKLEILPVGALRGRTFNDSMIFIDEAQDLTVSKMRMCATRLGENSRMAICGDPSHTELRSGERSGFAHLLDMIRDQKMAAIHTFNAGMIVRNPIVAELDTLYAQEDPSYFVPVGGAAFGQKTEGA